MSRANRRVIKSRGEYNATGRCAGSDENAKSSPPSAPGLTEESVGHSSKSQLVKEWCEAVHENMLTIVLCRGRVSRQGITTRAQRLAVCEEVPRTLRAEEGYVVLVDGRDEVMKSWVWRKRVLAFSASPFAAPTQASSAYIHFTLWTP